MSILLLTKCHVKIRLRFESASVLGLSVREKARQGWLNDILVRRMDACVIDSRNDWRR